MRTLWQDIRYGVRMLGRRPGLTVATTDLTSPIAAARIDPMVALRYEQQPQW